VAKNSSKKKLTIKKAHKYFSAQCFNNTWDYLDIPERTAEQDEEMLRSAMASHWHWTQRKDYGPVSESIASWQVSRVFAVLGQSDNAHRYGQRALDALEGQENLPFYQGYGYEALARAEAVAGDAAQMNSYLEKARQAAAEVSDEDSKKMLLVDLDTIGLV
jgi:hypothetical protein